MRSHLRRDDDRLFLVTDPGDDGDIESTCLGQIDDSWVSFSIPAGLDGQYECLLADYLSEPSARDLRDEARHHLMRAAT